jgi:hypothetical protein
MFIDHVDYQQYRKEFCEQENFLKVCLFFPEALCSISKVNLKCFVHFFTIMQFVTS